jgi:hypothetical protein
MYALLKFANKPQKLLLAIIATIAIWTSPSFALDPLDSFQIHGFINQGYFLSSDNNVYGNSDRNHGAFGLTEVGINSSIRPLNNIGLAIQAVYRHAGEVSDEARIDYALVDWSFLNADDLQAGVRLGRIKNPLGFYNDTRDVAFTRPSITLPTLYLERSRNLFLSADGVQIYLSSSSSVGDFSLQLNAGEPRDDLTEVEISFFNTDALGKLDPKTSYAARLEYESISGSTRLAFSYAETDMEYRPGTFDPLEAGDLSFDLSIFSIQQRLGAFTITGEYLRIHNSATHFGVFYPDIKPTSESYYLQANYQINPYLQGITRYSASFNNINDRDGKDSALSTGNPDYAAFQKGYMLGMRWDFHNSWMLQAEYHRIKGTSELSFADNPNRSATKQHWDLFALQLSYRF